MPHFQSPLRLQRFYHLILCIGALSGVSKHAMAMILNMQCIHLSAVSFALVCHLKLTVEVDNSFVTTMWNECFVKVCCYLKLAKYLHLLLFMQHYAKIVFDEETVSKMRIALKFHFSLALPQHCQLSGEQFVFLAIKGDAMRPFAHMRFVARQ